MDFDNYIFRKDLSDLIKSIIPETDFSYESEYENIYIGNVRISIEAETEMPDSTSVDHESFTNKIIELIKKHYEQEKRIRPEEVGNNELFDG